MRLGVCWAAPNIAFQRNTVRLGHRDVPLAEEGDGHHAGISACSMLASHLHRTAMWAGVLALSTGLGHLVDDGGKAPGGLRPRRGTCGVRRHHTQQDELGAHPGTETDRQGQGRRGPARCRRSSRGSSRPLPTTCSRPREERRLRRATTGRASFSDRWTASSITLGPPGWHIQLPMSSTVRLCSPRNAMTLSASPSLDPRRVARSSARCGSSRLLSRQPSASRCSSPG